MSAPGAENRRALIRAGGVVDARGTGAAPGALLVEGATVLAAGAPESIGCVGDAVTIDEPSAVIVPALVNAHAHLDLSHIDPEPFRGDFIDWITAVRGRRLTEHDAIRRTARRGADLARAGGTGLIGDIAGAGSTAPLEAMVDRELAGVGFLEVFGLGAARALGAIEHMNASIEAWLERGVEHDGVRIGLQPHAPYSCAVGVYAAAATSGRPVTSHVGETLDELRLVERGDGPLATMLDAFGIADRPARAAHPVDLLAEPLGAAPWLLAHLNYLDERTLQRLVALGVTVAYCPRASAYFGHPHEGRPPHAYARMLDAGIRVVLGTDGLLCLDTPDRISVLDEMRFLRRRDGTDPSTLLRMATVDGAAALGFEETLVSFEPGPIAGALAIDVEGTRDGPAGAVLESAAPPRWVVGPAPLESFA